MRYLNERFAALGIPHRIEYLAVLPYVNPMWMANWDAPQLVGLVESGILEQELREARWRYPQVLDEY